MKLTDVTESLGLRVSVVVDGTFLLLSAVVPGQLQQTFPLGDSVPDTLLGRGVRGGVGQEVQVELAIGVLNGANQLHAQRLLVVLETGLGVLHAKHGVVEAVGGRVGGRALVLVTLADDLNPVSIGVLHKGDVTHATLGQLLLERVASILNALARSLDVVDGDAKVTETTVGLRIAVHDAVVGVVLGAVVVGQLDIGIAIGKVGLALQGLGAVVCEEVVTELPLRHIHLLDHAEAQELVEFQ